jgi:hypothetical protein
MSSPAVPQRPRPHRRLTLALFALRDFLPNPCAFPLCALLSRSSERRFSPYACLVAPIRRRPPPYRGEGRMSSPSAKGNAFRRHARPIRFFSTRKRCCGRAFAVAGYRFAVLGTARTQIRKNARLPVTSGGRFPLRARTLICRFNGSVPGSRISARIGSSGLSGRGILVFRNPFSEYLSINSLISASDSPISLNCILLYRCLNP